MDLILHVKPLPPSLDKVSGKGTWESNPYVWAYEFELMK